MGGVVLVVLTVAVAVLLGLARGGRLRNIAGVTLDAIWLIGIAVAAQAVLAVAGTRAGGLGPVLLAGSQVALLGFLWRNRWLHGMGLVFVGLLLNALVITANGAMPVSTAAVARVTGQTAQHAVVPSGRHVPLEAGDPLPWLADVLPIPVLGQIASIGDIVLAAGIGVLIPNLMRGAPRAPGRRAPSSGRRCAPPQSSRRHSQPP